MILQSRSSICWQVIPFMTPLVPTGMQTGEGTSPCGSSMVSVRAQPHRFSTLDFSGLSQTLTFFLRVSYSEISSHIIFNYNNFFTAINKRPFFLLYFLRLFCSSMLLIGLYIIYFSSLMEVIKEGLSSQKDSEALGRSKQNYVPFISKSPRFHEPKVIAKQPQKQVIFGREGRMNIKNSVNVTPVKNNKEQFIFKSSTQRFETLAAEETPSPGSYSILSGSDTILPGKRMKTLGSNSRLRDNSQGKLCTLPTIPDKRNKFGVNFEIKETSFVEKSEMQLRREKELMKKYRESLSEEISLKKSGVVTPVHPLVELQKKVKAHLEAKLLSGKQNKNQPSKSQSQSRIKAQHLYEYHPIDNHAKASPFFAGPNLWQKKVKMQKYQFFDSTQKRFKDMCEISKSNPNLKLKKSVRQYMKKMATANMK